MKTEIEVIKTLTRYPQLVLPDLSNVCLDYTSEAFTLADDRYTPSVLKAMAELDSALSSGPFYALSRFRIVLAAPSAIAFPKLESTGVEVRIVYHDSLGVE